MFFILSFQYVSWDSKLLLVWDASCNFIGYNSFVRVNFKSSLCLDLLTFLLALAIPHDQLHIIRFIFGCHFSIHCALESAKEVSTGHFWFIMLDLPIFRAIFLWIVKFVHLRLICTRHIVIVQGDILLW